jgi:hypothetical protein
MAPEPTRSRDDSRTRLPILIRDPATGLYAPAVAFERIAFASTRSSRISRRRAQSSLPAARSVLAEPEGLRFGNLRRTNDGFFLKISYLFRL